MNQINRNIVENGVGYLYPAWERRECRGDAGAAAGLCRRFLVDMAAGNLLLLQGKFVLSSQATNASEQTGLP